jgi:hypothetical protein
LRRRSFGSSSAQNTAPAPALDTHTSPSRTHTHTIVAVTITPSLRQSAHANAGQIELVLLLWRLCVSQTRQLKPVLPVSPTPSCPILSNRTVSVAKSKLDFPTDCALVCCQQIHPSIHHHQPVSLSSLARSLGDHLFDGSYRQYGCAMSAWLPSSPCPAEHVLWWCRSWVRRTRTSCFDD